MKLKIMGNQTFLVYSSYHGPIEIVSYLLGLRTIDVNAVSFSFWQGR